MFSDLRQFEEAKKWAEEYARTKGNTAQVSMHMCAYPGWFVISAWNAQSPAVSVWRHLSSSCLRGVRPAVACPKTAISHAFMQVQELINKQAEWSEETKNFDGAADMYLKVRVLLLSRQLQARSYNCLLLFHSLQIAT